MRSKGDKAKKNEIWGGMLLRENMAYRYMACQKMFRTI